MNIDQSRIESLVARPSESLNVEVKRWISADEPNGISKLVRAVLALRNRNGGYLVIGFDDKTFEPDINNEPADVRAAFHFDKAIGRIAGAGGFQRGMVTRKFALIFLELP